MNQALTRSVEPTFTEAKEFKISLSYWTFLMPPWAFALSMTSY
jgi:hypothetical protein